MYIGLEQVFDHFLRRDFEQLGIVQILFEELERRGVIIPVANALVGHGFEVNVLALHEVAIHVQLHRLALGAEGDEQRQVAEVINVVIDRRDAERTEIGDDHGAVEGACVQQRLRDDAEIIHHPEHADGEAQQEAQGEPCRERSRDARPPREILPGEVAGEREGDREVPEDVRS